MANKNKKDSKGPGGYQGGQQGDPGKQPPSPPPSGNEDIGDVLYKYFNSAIGQMGQLGGYINQNKAPFGASPFGVQQIAPGQWNNPISQAAGDAGSALRNMFNQPPVAPNPQGDWGNPVSNAAAGAGSALSGMFRNQAPSPNAQGDWGNPISNLAAGAGSVLAGNGPRPDPNGDWGNPISNAAAGLGQGINNMFTNNRAPSQGPDGNWGNPVSQAAAGAGASINQAITGNPQMQQALNPHKIQWIASALNQVGMAPGRTMPAIAQGAVPGQMGVGASQGDVLADPRLRQVLNPQNIQWIDGLLDRLGVPKSQGGMFAAPGLPQPTAAAPQVGPQNPWWNANGQVPSPTTQAPTGNGLNYGTPTSPVPAPPPPAGGNAVYDPVSGRLIPQTESNLQNTPYKNLPYGSLPAGDRSDTSYGGQADRYYGPTMGAGSGNGGTGNGGGGNGSKVSDPWAGWKERLSNNGLNWDVLVDVYLNPSRNGTWGKFGDKNAEIGQAAENYMDDKLWGDTFYEQYNRGPNPTEWREHYESRTTYVDGQNYVLHDPLFTGNEQAQQSYNQKLANLKAQKQAEDNKDYVNEPPPNNW